MIYQSIWSRWSRSWSICTISRWSRSWSICTISRWSRSWSICTILSRWSICPTLSRWSISRYDLDDLDRDLSVRYFQWSRSSSIWSIATTVVPTTVLRPTLWIRRSFRPLSPLKPSRKSNQIGAKTLNIIAVSLGPTELLANLTPTSGLWLLATCGRQAGDIRGYLPYIRTDNPRVSYVDSYQTYVRWIGGDTVSLARFAY